MSSTCITGIMLEQFARCNFHGLIGQDSRLPQSFFFPVDLMNFHLTFSIISFLIQNAGVQTYLGFSLILNLKNNHLMNYSIKQLVFDKATSYITKSKHYKVQKVNKRSIQRTVFSKQYRCSMT